LPTNNHPAGVIIGGDSKPGSGFSGFQAFATPINSLLERRTRKLKHALQICVLSAFYLRFYLRHLRIVFNTKEA